MGNKIIFAYFSSSQGWRPPRAWPERGLLRLMVPLGRWQVDASGEQPSLHLSPSIS